MTTGVQLLDHNGRPFAMQDTSHFAASRAAREMRSWDPARLSADAALDGELETIVARAEDLVRNHGVAGGAIDTITDNVVGRGFRMRSKPDHRTLGWTPEYANEWSRDVESKWRSWAETTACDASGMRSFNALTALQFRSGMVAGEAAAIPVWLPGRPGVKWSTALQLIDPARIQSPTALDSERMRQGFEVDRYGRPVFVHVMKRHPSDGILGGNEFERIPMTTRWGRRRFIHVHDMKRTGQHRGTPVLAPVMGTFRMLDHYQRTELQSAVINAMIAAFIETPMDGEMVAQLFGDQAPAELGGNTPLERMMSMRNGWDVQLSGGAVIPLAPGDKMSTFNPGRPATAFAAFMETILRQVGTGLGLPYELLMRDFSKTNYSSARASLLEAWRMFNRRRQWLTSYWCQPAYELWFEEAVNAGEIEAPGFYDNPYAYTRARWIGDGRGWVDPVKESQAAQIRMEIGVSTLEDECAEQGRDYEEVLEQLSRENDLRKRLGLAPATLANVLAITAPTDEPDNDNVPDDQPVGRRDAA